MNATTKAKYFWKENFETFGMNEVKGYHFGVTQYPFSTVLYDQLMEEILEPYVKGSKPLNILDAGGGTGKWSVYFAQMNHKVTLIDVAKPMLNLADEIVKEMNLTDKVTIDHGTIVDLPYENESFDFVFSDRNPITHCGKKEQSHQSIREMYRVLKPGGILVGCVLNRFRKVAQMVMEYKFDEAMALMPEGDLQRGDSDYSHYYLAEELKDVLTNTGFKLIKLLPTTALTEFLPSAWLLDEIPIKKCLDLEKMAREYPDFIHFGVRFHFIVKK